MAPTGTQPPRWPRRLLITISIVLLVLGVVQFVSYLEWRDTRSCLESVAAQGKASRDSAILWLEDTRKLIAGPSRPGAESAFLDSLDTYHDALEAANKNAQCLTDEEDPQS